MGACCFRFTPNRINRTLEANLRIPKWRTARGAGGSQDDLAHEQPEVDRAGFLLGLAPKGLAARPSPGPPSVALSAVEHV